MVALLVAIIVETHIVLCEPLDGKAQSADICRGGIGFLADLETEAADGKRIWSERTIRDPRRDSP